MGTPRKTSIKEVKFALISILVRTLQSHKGGEHTRELRTKSVVDQGMQTCVVSIRSGYERE